MCLHFTIENEERGEHVLRQHLKDWGGYAKARRAIEGSWLSNKEEQLAVLDRMEAKDKAKAAADKFRKDLLAKVKAEMAEPGLKPLKPAKV